MALVYTVRFGAGTTVAGTARSVYAAPAGLTSVLRSIDIVTANAGTTSTHQISVPGIGYIVTYNGTTPNQSFHWDGRQVLLPGEVLTILSTTQTCSYFMTGYQLS